MEKIKIFGINYNLELKTVKTLEKGYDLYDNNDFGSAVNLFSSLQNDSNLRPFIFTLRGHAYHCLNKLEEAINDYNKTLSFYPTNYAALYRLAMVYYAKFDLKNSIKCLEKSLQNYPDIDTNYEDYLRNEMFNVPKVVILNNIGNFLGQIGKYDDSFKFFDEAIKLSPEYSFVYLSKGLMILEKSDNKEKATEYIRKAYELGNKKAYIFLSIIKRDYNAIITESNYNPLNIVNYTEQNKAHRLPNFIETFTRELYQICDIEKKTCDRGITMEFFSDILVQYSIFMLAECSDKAGGFLPVSIINDMKHQIIESAQKLFDLYKSEDLIEIFFSALDKQLFRKNCIVEANNIIYKYYGK